MSYLFWQDIKELLIHVYLMVNSQQARNFIDNLRAVLTDFTLIRSNSFSINFFIVIYCLSGADVINYLRF